MQILMVSSQKNWGGGELWMLSAALGLSHRGHQVTLVCQPGSGLAQRAQGQGYQPVAMRLRGDFDPLTVARFYSLIRRRRIQLICGNMSKEVRLAGLAAQLAGIPLVRRRGSDMPYPNKWRHRLIDAHLVRRIIVNSKATQQTLLRGNPWLAPQKLKLIYNGIPLEPEEGSASREEVLREFGLSESSPLITMVGLLKDRKGHETLFRAMPRVLKEFPQLSLLVVGEGPGRRHLEEFARQLGIDRSIRFTGFRDDVSRLMSAMDFLVLPSKNEGFGYVLAEAMSLGKSVVATRASSIPEVVAEGQTGLLVPPGDEDALAQAILELARHPEMARRMGLAGRQRVREKFSLERMLDELEDLFAEIIAEEHLGSDHR